MGVAIGIGASLAITRLISNLLVGVSATESIDICRRRSSSFTRRLAATYIPAPCHACQPRDGAALAKPRQSRDADDWLFQQDAELVCS
jgi:hypothetical protein